MDTETNTKTMLAFMTSFINIATYHFKATNNQRLPFCPRGNINTASDPTNWWNCVIQCKHCVGYWVVLVQRNMKYWYIRSTKPHKILKPSTCEHISPMLLHYLLTPMCWVHLRAICIRRNGLFISYVKTNQYLQTFRHHHSFL